MRARDMAEMYPVVELTTEAVAVAQLIARRSLPGVIVCGADGRPRAIVPSSQILRAILPHFVLDDPVLAGVYDPATSARLMTTRARRSVKDVLTDLETGELARVNPDATALEVAAVMARMHTPLVAVLEPDGELVGAITASRLLGTLFPDRAG